MEQVAPTNTFCIAAECMISVPIIALLWSKAGLTMRAPHTAHTRTHTHTHTLSLSLSVSLSALSLTRRCCQCRRRRRPLKAGQ